MHTSHEKLVCVDADNTLWDTNALYAAAQLGLLRAVEDLVGRTAPAIDRLGFVRAIDQRIAHGHASGLRYPYVELVHGIARVLEDQPGPRSGSRVGAAQAAAIAEAFTVRLANELPALRPGVARGLARLVADNVRLVVVTEGQRQRVERTIAQHGLTPRFADVVEGKKDRRLYATVGDGHRQRYSVGDQLDRDIVPARDAGYHTIYFPGEFDPFWHATLSPTLADVAIRDFDEVPEIVETEHMENRS